MKFHAVVILTSCLAWLVPAAAAPEASPSPEPVVKAPDKPLETLIHELADERFTVREEASRKIWEIGEPALEDLQNAAVGPEPEQAYRARELIRKIELHITPETSPAVIKLVERYSKASPNEKLGLFDQLQKQRAWRQMLKLFAAETNPELQSRLQQVVSGIAVTAARESLIKGNPNAAREYLEMAPADAPGLLALADFHRSQGTLAAELVRAKTLKGPQANAWLLALYRASGDLEGARAAADAAGENEVSAGLAVLQGDPLPWLRRAQTGEDAGKVYKAYTNIAIRRWQGESIQGGDLEILEREAKARPGVGDRENGISALFLLGQVAAAEAGLDGSSPQIPFAYYESQERVPEALKAIGLDPEKPDYTAWVEKRLEVISKDGDEEDDATTETPDLLNLANFMERRGLDKELDDAFRGPLLTLAADDERKFLDFLAPLFGDGRKSEGAPRLATRLAIEWAANDAQRWDDVISSAFGSEDGTAALWDWLSDLDSEAKRPERLEGLLALKGIGPDPRGLRAKWLGILWDLLGNTPEDRRGPLLEKAKIVMSLTPDLASNMKLWSMLPEEEAHAFKGTRILYFTASGRWNEAADFFLEQIQSIEKSRQEPKLEFHACAAACLRKAGRNEEAAYHDDLVDKLSLSKDSYNIAAGYAWGDDFEQAARWYAKGARMSDPLDNEFVVSLESMGEDLLKKGEWKQAASIFEVIAQMAVSSGSGLVNPGAKLRVRLEADLARALANLNSDRARSIALLDGCHRMFPSDGSLADYFFPAVRKAGLIKEHDEWFKISWSRITAVIKSYPKSDNTYNTAGWLASRAIRNLDEAENYLENALALNPDQSAYLDTMAEIQFARGRREKALEWSTRAVNFTPADTMLRQQLVHFRNDPLPK